MYIPAGQSVPQFEKTTRSGGGLARKAPDRVIFTLMKLLSPLLLPTLLGLASAAQAQSFDFTLNPASSSTTLVSTFGVDLPGTLIGDFDPINNPTGTTTLPGFLGGSGNNPIDVELGVSGGVDFTRVPTGGFRLDLSMKSMSVDVSDLELDLLGGSPATSDTLLSLLFDTFRTTNPTSLFIGNIPLDIPIGSQTVSELTLVQSGPSTLGFLVPTGTPGEFTLTAVVPVTLTMNVEFFGTSFPIGPVDLPLPIAGDLTMDADTAQVTIAFGQMFQQSLPDPLPGFELADIPFPLPTILPPGGVANLLFTLAIGALDVDLNLSANWVADGVPPCGFSSYCSANPNSTGLSTELTVTGSTTVADADLTLSASNMPSNVFGIYIMSQARDVVPFGGNSEGFLCVGEPCYRIQQKVVLSDALGMADLSLNFNDLPQGQVFTPGSTWHFQLWHRDRNPGPTSNTSHGVTVRFCD